MGAGAAMALPVLLQTGFGIHQYIKGSKEMKNLQRPTKQVQDEYRQNVALSEDLYGAAKRQANVGMGEQQKALAQDMLLQNQATGINAALQGGLGLRGIAQQQSNAADMMRNILQMDIQQQMANKGNVFNQAGNLMAQRGILGQQEQDVWQYNQGDKYAEELLSAQSLIGGGVQNITGGAKTAGEFGSAYMGMQ